MNIYKKLLEIKRKLPYLQKNKKGFNYSYVTPSKVLAEVNPVLNDAGIILVTKIIDCKSYEITTGKGEKQKTEWKYDVSFMFEWVDTEDGEKIEIPFFASGVNGEDKGLGSAITYAERYFIMKQFNIPVDDDDPDSFQEKHMTEAEKKERAISEVKSAKTSEEGNALWAKHKAFQKDADFLKAVNELKTKLKPETA